MPRRRLPSSTNPILRWVAFVPLPFLLLFLALASDALRITPGGLGTVMPPGTQIIKALVLVAILFVGLPGLWSRRAWRRTIAHAVAALADASGAAHGIVWTLIGLNGGLEGTGPRAPTWLLGLFLLGGLVSAAGFGAVVVLVVRDLRRQ